MLKKILFQVEGPEPKILVHLNDGWILEGSQYQVFDSYLSALAYQSNCWEEYCEFHRVKKI